MGDDLEVPEAMSIEKTCGLLRTGYWNGDPDEFGAFPGREFHGPLAIPIAIGAATLFSAVSSSVNQNKAAHASEALQGQEEQQIGQQEQLAGQIANQPIDLSGITRAGQSSIETIKNGATQGVPNANALVEQLLGQNNLSSQQAALGQKTTNLNTAAGILNGTNSSLNQLGTQAGAAAGAGGNPWTAAAGPISNAFKAPGSSQPVATGPGTPGGGDITTPGPSSASFGSNIPSGGSGFTVTSPFGPGGDGGDSSDWSLPAGLVAA